MNKIVTLLCLVSLVLSCFVGCGVSGRDYNDDIVFGLQNEADVIIIKEWRYLLGSGAEVYYKHAEEDPILLGKTSGADDGFCPFREGLYEIAQDANSVHISWCATPSNRDRSFWHSKTFSLPERRDDV